MVQVWLIFSDISTLLGLSSWLSVDLEKSELNSTESLDGDSEKSPIKFITSKPISVSRCWSVERFLNLIQIKKSLWDKLYDEK